MQFSVFAVTLPAILYSSCQVLLDLLSSVSELVIVLFHTTFQTPAVSYHRLSYNVSQ